MNNRRSARGVRHALLVAGLGVTAVGAGVAACGEGSSPPTSSNPNDTIATITLSPVNPSVPLGSSLELTPSLADSAGQPLTTTGRTIEWASSRPDIVRVSDQGVVQALELGTATITATSERKIGSTVVTAVQPPVVEVVVTPPTAEVGPFGSVQLSATPRASDGREVTGKSVLWSSSAPAVMTVDGSGFVNALVSTGTATIFAQVDGITGFATIVIR